MRNNDTLVKIAVNKSLLKEFLVNSQRTVYIDNGSEFQIQIFNPYTYSIAASISINGVGMSNQLVIKPGQRIWLERYLNEARKFLFETYEVNSNSKQVQNAIRHNGVVEISFYKEKQQNNNIYIKSITTPTWNELSTTIDYLNGPSGVYYSNNSLTATTDISSSINYSTSLGLGSVGSTYNTASASVKPRSKSIETGRIEKGSHSNQKFQTVYDDFEYFAFTTETIHILPQSTKPVYANDLKKIYCTNCGRKMNQKFKYCPYCGAKQ